MNRRMEDIDKWQWKNERNGMVNQINLKNKNCE